MNGKERKWAARDAADERRGNIPPKPQEIKQTCQCDQLRLDFDAEIRERRAAVCERDEAIRERDEARRLACGALASGGWDLFANPDDWGVDRGRDLCMRDFAAERNWDCFKSDHIGGTNEMAPDE